MRGESYYAGLTDPKIRGYRQAQEPYDYNTIKLGMDVQTNGHGQVRYMPWLNVPDTDGEYHRMNSNVWLHSSLAAVKLAQAGREVLYENEKGH